MDIGIAIREFADNSFREGTLLAWFISTILSFITYLLGGWTPLLTMLAVLIILDFVTGIIRGAYGLGLDSRISSKGVTKKIYIFLMVGIAHFVDVLIGSADFVKNIAMIFYIISEMISITENVGAIGCPVPKKIKQLIRILK